MRTQTQKLKFRSVFVSDTHLWKRAASAEYLVEFLENMECDNLYLVGDIIEGWGLKAEKRAPFPEMHARSVDGINAHAHRGTKVTYLRGNHDEDIAKRRYRLMNRTVNFSNRNRDIIVPISFAKSVVHTGLDGLKYLVLHGDVFDAYQKEAGKKKIAKMADLAYDNIVYLNYVFRTATYGLTGKHISPAKHLKKATKDIVGVIGDFERSVARQSIRDQFSGGVICGHIHHAEIKDINGIRYMNDGDWVESATCLVETEEGEWKILDWSQERLNLGLDRLPTVTDPNSFQAFRSVTERQLAGIRRIWKGKGYEKLIFAHREHRDRLIELEDKLQRSFNNASSGKLEKLHRKILNQEEKISRIEMQLQPHPLAS